MPKQTKQPVPLEPTWPKEQGKRALVQMKEKGEKLLANRPIPEGAANTWYTSTYDFIKKSFGWPSGHLSNFSGPQSIVISNLNEPPDEARLEYERHADLRRQVAVVASIIEQLELDISLETPDTLSLADPDDLVWALLHPKVTSQAKPRFEAGHYADGVEAALKELNAVVKEMVKRKTGQELDGADLMQKAFSPNAPVLIALDDQSTETGRSIQKGYMQLFAGAMTGIRNPKAHQNLQITKERAFHHLFLASLLFNKLDERP